MTTVVKTAQAPFGAITAHRTSSVVFRAIETVERWLERRRTLAELSRLTDAQLDDIGLTRADVYDLQSRF